MKEKPKEKQIKKLSTWDLHTVVKLDGYELTTLPSPTAENMLIYLEKINELVSLVNQLEETNR
jgi:hypothetical protein